MDQRNETEVLTSENVRPENIIPVITLKDTRLVASLKIDSPSIIKFNLLGTVNLLKTEATATASVDAMIDPKSSPSINLISKIALKPNATIKIVRITPITEKNPIGIISLLISRSFNFRPDSKIRIGRMTKNIRSGNLFVVKS
jgi:hypothetical protein